MANACFEHPNFFTVDVRPADVQRQSSPAQRVPEKEDTLTETAKTAPDSVLRNPTTSVLAATTLINAIGAGITAAAGHFNRATPCW